MARIQQSIEVNVPVHTAYRQLVQFEEYPRFMEYIEEVRQVDDRHLHWHSRFPDQDIQWDAEITEQVPDRCIAWRNTSGPRNIGKVELHPVENERTRVTLTMDVEAQEENMPQQQASEAAIAERTSDDLSRFKKFVESREPAALRYGQHAGVHPGRNGESGPHAGGQGMRQEQHPSGYAGADATDVKTGGASSYAAGAEGWDGNEDPGVAISAGLQPPPGQDDRQQPAPVGATSPRQGDATTQSPSALSQSLSDAAGHPQPLVAEEQSFDQQSAQARRVGQIPGAGSGIPGQSPAQAVAASMQQEQGPSAPSDRQAGMQAKEEKGEKGEKNEKGDKEARASAQPSWLPNLLHAWEEPFVVMRKMTEEMDQIFEKFVGRPLSAAVSTVSKQREAAPSGTAWSPPVEVMERDNRLIVSAELPGVRREDVSVEIRHDRLIIEGDRNEDLQGQGLRRSSERSYGHFYRAIPLPPGIDMDQASASMQDGVLQISLPVRTEGEPGRKLVIR